MKKTLIFSVSASALLFAGCTTTTIYSPENTRTNLRQERVTSSEEYREVTQAAVNSAMANPKFISFLKRYKAEMKDPEAIPVAKLDHTVNDTDDPDLNTDEMTDMLYEALLNAGKLDVTLAEGYGRTGAIAASRELENDDNFDQSTVAKRGTLQAARLLLRPKVINNTVTDGGKRAVVSTFVMDMVDVKTGLVMWKFTKQLGYIKDRGVFGW